MNIESALVVVHHEDKRCFIPNNIKGKIDQLIGLFPKNLVYYTPLDQHQYPLNNLEETVNDKVNNIYFVGCYMKPDACVPSQIRLLYSNKQSFILIEDALFEKEDIPSTMKFLKQEEINLKLVNSSELLSKYK